MAEPHNNPVKPEEPKAASAASSPVESDVAKEEDLFQRVSPEPTDETPTVISRGTPTPVRPEEVLAGVLRGRRLAHFELLEPIGVGGMAAVIAARDTQLDRKVALKILPPEMAGDPENVRRFHQEARAAAKLDHENIARVFFCGEDQGLHFIAFEFVEGENLAAMLQGRGHIPVSEAIDYTLQIATGLAHAATRAVVHRDIKPSNIIINAAGRAKLVDMGLARSLEPQADGGLTRSGVTLGTFDYISPEQAMEPREADVRSDIYSLGCTLYHMLTGQPSVPEGTAAKKLHHHQHIDPVDPRQFNPDIPDDVAALLARMMAKQPAERYQRPEQLVRHLIGLAQKLDVPVNLPEGFLLDDMPLLAPPKTRPLLVTSLAVLGMVALVFILTWPLPSMQPGKLRDPQRASLPSQSDNGPPPAQPAAEPPPIIERLSPSVPEPKVVTYQFQDVKDLAEHLRKHPETRTVYLNDDITLSREETLTLQDHNLTIKPEDPKRRPTIRLRGESAPDGEPFFAVTVKSGRVTFSGVRFEAEVPRNALDLRMAAIDLQGGWLKLEHCEFIQIHQVEPSQGSIASIRVGGSLLSSERAELVLDGCYFRSGQHAVALSRPATVRASDCAFGPHQAALFRFREWGRDMGLEANVSLRNCSAILTGGTAFKLEGDTACMLRTEDTVFSQPNRESGAQSTATLIAQTGEPSGRFRYSGLHNCYHNLKSFWVGSSGAGAEKAAADLASFRQHPGVEDKQSLELVDSPWETPDPLPMLEDERPRLAFRLNPSLPLLRQVEDKTRLIGVEDCIWGKTYRGTLGALEPKKPPDSVPRNEERVVMLGDNSYRTLLQALEDAKRGDTLLIKKNGPFRVDTLRLLKRDVDVTIKPYPGYHPILLIGQMDDKDAAFFRLHDGQLKLEQLEFRLTATVATLSSQALVAMMGDGQCTFKDCLITLEETKGTPLALVTLPDTSNVMRMGTATLPSSVPTVYLEGCFVRGAGDLVAVRAGRPLHLEMANSLVALTGSLLTLEGSAKENGARLARADLLLKHVTTYLSDNLVCLRAGKEENKTGRGPVPVHVEDVSNTLFVSALGKPLIHLDGVDTDDQMKHCFSWGHSEHNAYSGFVDRLLDQQPADSAMMAPVPYGANQWREFTKETDARFDRVRFANLPDPSLAKATPADFNPVPEANWQDYGVNIERLVEGLPKPAEESSPRERSSGD
jgi:serine/threonine protein kinase